MALRDLVSWYNREHNHGTFMVDNLKYARKTDYYFRTLDCFKSIFFVLKLQ